MAKITHISRFSVTIETNQKDVVEFTKLHRNEENFHIEHTSPAGETFSVGKDAVVSLQFGEFGKYTVIFNGLCLITELG
jgi:hypothetical protein